MLLQIYLDWLYDNSKQYRKANSTTVGWDNHCALALIRILTFKGAEDHDKPKHHRKIYTP